LARRTELALSIGTPLWSKLTYHFSLSAGVALNFNEVWAAELRGTYSLAGNNGLGDRVGSTFLKRPPQADEFTDDLSDLWQMRGSFLAGARWAPIYGKLSLLSELPIHFQAYAWLGAGLASLHRESLAYCLSPEVDGAGVRTGGCGEWLTENRIAPAGSFALGMRFFTHRAGSIKLELRNYFFPDEYRTGIRRAQAEAGDAEQGTSGGHGLTALWMLDAGYSFHF
jgi:outer membrane beta-barrel protein